MTSLFMGGAKCCLWAVPTICENFKNVLLVFYYYKKSKCAVLSTMQGNLTALPTTS